MKFRISRLLPLIGIVIFLYVLSSIDLSKLINDFQNMNIWIYLSSFVIVIVSIPVKALKWKYLVKTYNINFSLSTAIRSWLIGFSIGQITPGRVGDLARAYYLKNETRVGKSLTTVLIDRLIDVGILIVLAIVGLYFFVTYYVNNMFLLPVLVLISVGFLVFLFLLTKEDWIRKILRPFYKHMLPEKFKSPSSSLFSDFFSGLVDMKNSKKNIVISIALGVVLWFVYVVELYLVGLSINLEVSLFFMFIAAPISILLETLPISFSGVGVRDVSLIYFFSYISIAAASAVSVSLLVLILNYFVTFLGLVFWMKDPIKIEELTKVN